MSVGTHSLHFILHTCQSERTSHTLRHLVQKSRRTDGSDGLKVMCTKCHSITRSGFAFLIFFCGFQGHRSHSSSYILLEDAVVLRSAKTGKKTRQLPKNSNLKPQRCGCTASSAPSRHTSCPSWHVSGQIRRFVAKQRVVVTRLLSNLSLSLNFSPPSYLRLLSYFGRVPPLR